MEIQTHIRYSNLKVKIIYRSYLASNDNIKKYAHFTAMCNSLINKALEIRQKEVRAENVFLSERLNFRRFSNAPSPPFIFLCENFVSILSRRVGPSNVMIRRRRPEIMHDGDGRRAL